MKRIIETTDAPAAVGPYSQAVEAGGFLFVSGQIPLDPATGQIVGEEIELQVAQVLKNMEAVLKAAGYTVKDVVKTTCLLADMADFPVFNEIYGRTFDENPPARATFAARQLPLGVKVEVEAVACLS